MEEINMAGRNISTMLGNVQARERNIVRNVYLWMCAGLGVTAVTAFSVATNPTLMRALLSSSFSLILLMIVQFGLVIYLSSKIQDMSRNRATGTFLLYAFVTGITFSTIFYAFSLGVIFKAFLTAALMFGGMAAYATTTQKNLSGIGYYSGMALWGLIAAMLVNFFLKSSMLDLMISVVGVFIFLGLTAWDVQKIKRTNDQYGARMGELDYHRVSIYGALTLYLDFINIFLFLLRIFGRSDN